MKTLLKEAQVHFEFTRSVRRDLHRNPELGFQEIRTAEVVAKELAQLGMEVSTGIAKTGVTAVLEGAQIKPRVLLRFDMDALPIQEESGVEYISTHPGVMHACGHDGHVATGLTVARILKKYQDRLPISVQFVFQPAEEGLGGAKTMIEAGVIKQPGTKYALAFHLWNERPVGWLGIVSGPVMAGADAFTIQVTGKGGHGAIPSQAIDPVIILAQLIMALQTIVSRNVSPLENAVISIGQVCAGESHNVIPQRATIKGTIRTFEPQVRTRIFERIETLCKGFESAFHCQIELTTRQTTPPVVNDVRVTRLVEETAKQLFENVNIEKNYQTMVSEDMAYFLQAVPGCFILVGSSNEGEGLAHSHHNPHFDFDEKALINAAALLAGVVLRVKDLENTKPGIV